MKRVLKTLTVSTLATCLTTLHSAAAFAQGQNNLDTRVSRPKVAKEELATPSAYIAPQSGTLVDIGYTRSQTEYTIKGYKASGGTNYSASKMAVAINPNFFLTVEAAYRSASANYESQVNSEPIVTHESNSQGVTDPEIGAGMRINSGPVSTLVQLEAKIPTGDSESTTLANGNSERNEKSGGGSITPRVSVFTNNKSNFLFGGTVNYVINQDQKHIDTDNIQSATYSYTVSGGNIFQAGLFAETPQTSHSFGAAFIYMKSETSKGQGSGISYNSDGTEQGALVAYANLKVASHFSIHPSLGYVRYFNDKIGSTPIDSQNIYFGGLNGRLTF